MKISNRIIVLTVSLFVLLSSAKAENCQAAGWSRIATHAIARNGGASALIDGKIYSADGRDPAGDVEIYDIASGSFATSAPKLVGRWGSVGANLGGKFVVVAGSPIPYGSLKVESYDPASDKWSYLADMPSPGGWGAGAGVADGKLYVVGGYNWRTYGQNILRIYDPAKNSWTMGAPMPTRRSWLGAEMINGKYYVVGGWDYNDWMDLPTLEVYDPVTNVWTSKKPMPKGLRLMATAVLNGKLYVIGGMTGEYQGTKYYSDVYIYDPATDSWSSGESLPYPMAGLSAEVYDGVIYLLGVYPSATSTERYIYALGESNHAPVLSYADGQGYGQNDPSQGVDPDKGNASTTEFVFKTVYTDQDNNAPKDFSVVIRKEGEAENRIIQLAKATDAAAILRDGDYKNGEEYGVTSRFQQGKYEYYFTAADDKASVRWPASGSFRFEAGYSNIVFIPGIEASRLYKQGALLENRLWEPNRKADVEKLFLDYNGSSLDPSIYTRDVIDEVYGTPLMPNIYKTFLQSLDKMVADKTINGRKEFPYDWRMGIDNIVSGVIKTDTGGYAMTQEIESMASSSQTGRVTIVAHSMGGIVAKRLMQKLESEGHGGLVDKLILVASPQAGTPSAISALLHGDDQELGGGLILNKATARQLGENMRSAYSLLPSPRYFETAVNPVVEFDATSVLLQGLRNDFGNAINSSESLVRFLSGDDGRNDPLRDDTDTPNVLSLPMLAESADLHASIDAWTPPAGLEIIQIAGWGLDTISGIRYKERQIRRCPDNNYFSPQCVYETVYDREPVFSVEGDETVMTNSTDIIPSERKYYFNLEQNNKESDELIDKNHKNILEAKSLLNLVSDLIANKFDALPNYLYRQKSELSIDSNKWRVSVHSPVSVDLYDSIGRHTGLIANPNPDSDLAMVEEQIPNSYYLEFGEGKYAGVGSSAYTLDLKGTDYGTFTLDITKVQSDSETTLTYADIPVMPSTNVKVNVVDENIGALEMDMNGDGQTDFKIGSPGESIDPIGYVDIIMEAVRNIPMDKQMRNYLTVKLRVIKDKIGKDNAQALKEMTELTESYIIKKTGKFIGEGEAKVLVDMIANLKNLIKI